MNKLLTTFVLLTLLSTIETFTLPNINALLNSFKGFDARFKKKYRSSSEYNYRQEIYDQNMQDIQNFNKEKHSWNKGENMFTDMTDQEKRIYLGALALPSNVDVANLNNSFPNGNVESSDNNAAPVASGLVGSTTTTDPFASLPQKIDWQAAGIITPVKNQGSCGSCWAFTATAIVESLYQKKFNYALNLSEQELIDCATTSTYINYGCSGGFSINALSYYKLFGVVMEQYYPYTTTQKTCKRPLTVGAYNINKVTTVQTGSLIAFLKALSIGPVATAYFVANDFFSYKSGIYVPSAACVASTTINHAVLAVGYDLNPAAPYIKFKNSWGSTFGESGYFRMSINLVDAGNGPCNLLKFGVTGYAAI